MKTAKYLMVVLVLLLVSSLASSCFYIQTPSLPTLPPPTTPSPVATAPTNPTWTLPPVTSQNPPLPDFISVVSKIASSVVSINTEFTTFDFFNRQFTEEGAGSGWILDNNGHIVTNNHVIEGAQSITVALSDNRTFPARIVGADSLADIAVLKIEATDLTPATIGDSTKLRIGEWVLAIGNALGMGISAKEGIISRLGVSIPVDVGQTLYDLIETSAPINPGNSGGPLVNMAGEVIGITSAKLAAVDVEGLGYAISAHTASPVIEQLVRKGYVIRPWLGVTLVTVNQRLVLRYSLQANKGAFIAEIAASSPAAKAGLLVGDVIVNANGKEIASSEDLILVIHGGQIEGEINLTFWRGKDTYTAKAILIESPAP